MPVVDASVVVDWVAPDVDRTGAAGRFLQAVVGAGDRLLAPRILVEEVAKALLTGVRRGRWDGAAADVAYRQLRRLPVIIAGEPADLDRAWELSRRYDEHPVYDMLYVALAERLGERLVTQDTRLRERVTMLDFVVSP